MRSTSRKKRSSKKTDTLLRRFGPGLITGAADDDPSGIATYSQAGAQFGFATLWTMVLTFPLMAAVFVVEVPWAKVLWGVARPQFQLRSEYVLMIVAIFGTTISPYLFFWQASQENEDRRAAKGEKVLFMGRFVIRGYLLAMGWTTTVVMATAVGAMFFYMAIE